MRFGISNISGFSFVFIDKIALTYLGNERGRNHRSLAPAYLSSKRTIVAEFKSSHLLIRLVINFLINIDGSGNMMINFNSYMSLFISSG